MAYKYQLTKELKMADETKKCPKCKEDIAKGAKKCKHCGADLRRWFARHKIITGWLIFGLLAFLSILGNSTDTSQTAKVGEQSETKYKVGDVVTTDKFEILVTAVEEKAKVGGEYFSSSPSQGGTYVAVRFSYKNVSGSPISSWSNPTIKLVDSKGNKYDSDINASSNYATEVEPDRKILSDLNPGITVKDAKVFEISKDLYATGNWELQVSADKSYIVRIK